MEFYIFKFKITCSCTRKNKSQENCQIQNTLKTYTQLVMILTLISFSIFQSKTGHNLVGSQVLRINEPKNQMGEVKRADKNISENLTASRCQA